MIKDVKRSKILKEENKSKWKREIEKERKIGYKKLGERGRKIR
jgi:hypothetical protein